MRGDTFLRSQSAVISYTVRQDLLSYVGVLMVSLLQGLLLLFHFCLFLSRLSELLWKLAGEISFQMPLKRFTSLGPPANGNESN